ncbi:hypothetical protein A4X13_0g3875 [Tilletia indica]|uniref:Uncharacterized protein n=1 Tax=Tilletia indica TaxID=43049 RepID=A0A177TFF3_9BASI|nr:hypothetical protein A4X13_0g3875 [Tilletia indica]
METTFKIQAFFSILTQDNRICLPEHLRNSAPSFSSRLDVPVLRQEGQDNSINAAVSAFLAETTKGTCDIRVVDICRSETTIIRQALNLPACLDIDLLSQNKEEQLWKVDQKITIMDQKHILVGRVCATTAGGQHFYSIVHVPSRGSKIKFDGIYKYNDMKDGGRAHLLQATSPKPSAEDMTELCQPRLFS